MKRLLITVIASCFVLSCTNSKKQVIKQPTIQQKPGRQEPAKLTIPDKKRVDYYPAWVKRPNIDGYMGAVGVGSIQVEGGYIAQKRVAVISAQAELAKQIRVLIKSEFIDETVYEKLQIDKKTVESYKTRILSLSKQEAQEVIKGSIVKDEWVNPETGHLYVHVIIKKFQQKPEQKKIETVIQPTRRPQVIKNVTAEGSCAVVGMSAEQSQLIALQRARALAIEKAAGTKVSSSSLVTNGRMAVDFIGTYSKGFIIKETIEWLPLGQYQKNPSSAPILEYRVMITADIYIPEKKIQPIGIEAKLNNTIFRDGEEAAIEVKTRRKAKIAIFNIMADDKIVMLFPNQYSKDNIISENGSLIFPAKGSQVKVVVKTLPGHKSDAEALLIVAMDAGQKSDFNNLFASFQPMSFSAFYNKYSKIADYCEDIMLTYEVFGQ